MTVTVHVSIGNSDDKLSQREWSQFVTRARITLGLYARQFHGSWFSAPFEPWQNACWCVEFSNEQYAEVAKSGMARLAGEFHQDSVAWTVGTTEFVKGINR